MKKMTTLALNYPKNDYIVCIENIKLFKELTAICQFMNINVPNVSVG